MVKVALEWASETRQELPVDSYKNSFTSSHYRKETISAYVGQYFMLLSTLFPLKRNFISQETILSNLFICFMFQASGLNS